MYLDGAEGFLEFLRGNLPIYVIAFLPILIAISPITPALGSHEFTVYRMQQYDLQGTPHGCRSSMVNTEARALHSSAYTRKTVIARLEELTYGQFSEMLQQGAAGLLVLLPSNLSSVPADRQQHLMELEHILQEDAVPMPVYFAYETPELRDMYSSVATHGGQSGSVAEEMWQMLKSSGFQLVVPGAQARALTDFELTSIQGKLSGFGVEEHLPTGVIVAHYDSYGISPALSFGADSNGSGVAALLELVRLLSRLYTSSRTHPQFNLIFLLSAGGKFNYHGTKKWIEDNIDSSEGSLLPDSLFTMCLDSLGADDELYFHVSKPPKEGSAPAALLAELQRVVRELYPDELQVSLVHKKINLADETLAWEHERFSMRRLPAFTLSRLASHRALSRASVFDTRERVQLGKLSRNVKVIAEALVRVLYNTTGVKFTEVFTESLAVQPGYLATWLNLLSNEARSVQLLASSKTKVVQTLEEAMGKHLKEVALSTFSPDRRDPEVTFYDTSVAVMNAYSVKPAVFDLFLAALIAAYLATVYVLVLNFHCVQRVVGILSLPVMRSKAN